MSLRAKLIYIVLSSVSVAFFAFGGTAVYADGADGPFIDDGAKQNAMNYSAQQAVIRCTLLGDYYFSADGVNANYPVARDSILAGKSWWRYDNRWEVAKMGYFDDTDDGMLNCAGDDNTNSLEGKALGVIGRLGWTNPLTAYCELTGNTTINGKACGTDNDSMPPTVLSGGNITSTRNALAAKNGGSLRTLSDAGRYVSDWQALQYACGIGAGVEVKASDPNVDVNGNPVPTANTLLLTVVNKDGTTSQVRFQTSRTPPEYIEAFSVGANGDGIGFRSCQEVGNDLNAYAGKYALYIGENQDKLTEADERGDAAQEITPVCTGGGLGFILCPLTTLASQAIETLAESMEGFMRFSPLIGSAQGNAVLTLWRMMVGIANILMVIAFMVIIFSQATSVGLSAYGIKKMLPRIIAAAILINLSFWICALMVDITNIIGASIPGIINSASADIGKGTSLDLATAPTFGTAVIQLTLLAIVPTLGAAALGALAFVLPVLISGFLSILAIFVVLALRHVITILLIIISPLAFAAMILPNTEGLFKKWLKALYISLALYPIIMLLAYGSMLVSRIILVAAPDAPDKGGEVWIWEVLAFVVIFAWIFALKTVVSLGGGLVAKLAGKINDPTKGVIDRSRNWAKEKQARSGWGQMRTLSKNAANTAAQRRAIERLGKKNVMGVVARTGAYGTSGLWGGKGITPYGKKSGALLSTQADKVMAGIQKEQREVQGEYMTRSASELAARGVRLAQDGKTLLDSGGARYGDIASLDLRSRDAMKYIRDNNMMDSVNGMKAIAGNLHATGGMNDPNLARMYKQVQSIDPTSTTDFVEFNNEQARTVSKLSHMMFNAVDGDNELLVGGNLTPEPGKTYHDAITSKIMGGGFGSLHKDVFGDKDMEHSKALIDAIGRMQRTDSTGYASELAKMDNSQVEKYAGMIARVRQNNADALASEAEIEALMKARSAAREQFKAI